MAGKPFKVGRFAHTLRIRLMREHLGVDVDKLYTEDLLSKSPVHNANEVAQWDPDEEEGTGYDEEGYNKPKKLRTGFFGHAREEAKGPIDQRMHDMLARCCSSLYLTEIYLVVHGVDDDFTGDLAKASKKLGFTSNNMDSRANDKTLDAERTMINRKGEEVPGFASSVVPTIEEQVVNERRPQKTSSSDKPIKDELDAERVKDSTPDGDVTRSGDEPLGEPAEARVHDSSNELFGAPAEASGSLQVDDAPPHAPHTTIDADEEENAAPSARKILRQHLSVKVGAKPWTVPTPRPEIDPHAFDDPVSDGFYKEVWLAAATHNVCIHKQPTRSISTHIRYKFRPKFTEKCFTVLLMTLSPPGSSIRNSSNIKNG